MKPSLVYLAAPYSHPDKRVQQARFEQINEAAARLMADGLLIFSPISHTHPIALAGNLPTDFAYWERYDRAILACCSRMIVLKLQGWEQSLGVKAELAIADELELPVEFMEPNQSPSTNPNH